MACPLAKPDSAERSDHEIFITLGRWDISLADLDALQARLKSPSPADVRMARKVVNAVIELFFYDPSNPPWSLLTARERRALNGDKRP
jgi:hypothetical protein